MQFQRGNIGLFFKGDPTLKLWMPFEEGSGTSTRDLSGSGNHGTLTNGPIFMTGKFGNGILFDGTNDWISGLGNFGKPNTLTIALWFKTTNANWGVLFGQADVNPSTIPISYVPSLAIKNTGVLRAEFWNGNIEEISTPFSVTDGKWHFVVLTGNINTQSLYVDGKFIGSRSGTINQSWWNVCQIGVGRGNTLRGFPSDAWYYFNGLIDEVAIFSRALSPQEISQYYSWAIGTPKRKYIFAPSVPEPNFFPFF